MADIKTNKGAKIFVTAEQLDNATGDYFFHNSLADLTKNIEEGNEEIDIGENIEVLELSVVSVTKYKYVAKLEKVPDVKEKSQ